MWSVTNNFLLNLAIADLLGKLLNLYRVKRRNNHDMYINIKVSFVPRHESGRSYMIGVSIFPLSNILIFDFGIVPTVWYFLLPIADLLGKLLNLYRVKRRNNHDMYINIKVSLFHITNNLHTAHKTFTEQWYSVGSV
jgi:hypothetical protein